MTSAENTPTEPIPAPESTPATTAPMYAAPAEQSAPPAAFAPEEPRHKHGHFLPSEGVALVVVGALLFGAFAFAVGWFGGSMSTRFAERRAFVMAHAYSYGQNQGQSFGNGNGQGSGPGHGFGMGRGYGRRYMMPQGLGSQGQGTQPNGGQQGWVPYGSSPATQPAQ